MQSAHRYAAMFSLVVALQPGLVSSQTYPTKAIRIVTSEPGGGTDFTARTVATGISGPLGQPVIVENRGSGIITGEIVARATPDGHTLLIAGASLWNGPLFRKTSYNPLRDLSFISMLVNSPNILVVHPSVPVQSVKDLIALAKAKPGSLNYGSSGTGASAHLASELFKSMAVVDIVHVPYKGSGPIINAIISGEVQVLFATPASVAPHLKSGKLRALAVTSLKPSLLAPQLPTVASSVPGYDTGGFTAMFAPAKTPAPIVKRLNQEVVRVLTSPEVKERFLKVGVEVVASSPEELSAWMKLEIARMGKVIADAGLRSD